MLECTFRYDHGGLIVRIPTDDGVYEVYGQAGDGASELRAQIVETATGYAISDEMLSVADPVTEEN